MSVLTKRQYLLNGVWFLLFAFFLLALIYGALLESASLLTKVTSGIAFIILVVVLAKNAARSRTVEPPHLQNKTFLPFLIATGCVILGYWNQGLSLVSLVWPLSLYVVFACNDRLLDWAKEK